MIGKNAASFITCSSTFWNSVWDLSSAGWSADWTGTGGELSYFKPLFSGKPSFPPLGSNFGLYDSPKANQLIDQAVAAKTADQSQALFQKADMQVMKDAAVYPIADPNEGSITGSQVHNCVVIQPLQNCNLANVWLSS